MFRLGGDGLEKQLEVGYTTLFAQSQWKNPTVREVVSFCPVAAIPGAAPRLLGKISFPFREGYQPAPSAEHWPPRNVTGRWHARHQICVPCSPGSRCSNKQGWRLQF